MTHRGLLCLLLLGTVAWGQTAKPTTTTPAPAPEASQSADAKTPAPAADPSKVAADAPVITIPGLCNNGDKSSPDCKTVVTKAQFEALINAVAPTMPPTARRQLATRYAGALVMANEAEKQGLDKGPRFEEMMKVSRIQVLQQELGRSMQEKADQVPDKDIQDYYNANKAQFEEADLHRLFIPKNKQLEPPKEKLSDAAMQKRQADAEAAMKAVAEKLQARAAAGEDLDKLQGEAFEAAGLKAKAPNTALGKIRRSALPPAHASAFDLKPGQVSPLITDTSGFFVYKLTDRDAEPLDKAKDEIHNTLRGQRMQESMEGVQKAATPNLNEEYFGPEEAPSGAGMAPGGMKPPVRRPMPGKAPAATATTEPK
jgi:parvulin-like peptidyl-prolyl cis-trans isomerase-like protein